MSGGPRGTPPPLDLRAVEARLRAFDAMAHGAAIPFSQETRALLAHTRALRELVELGRITLTDNGAFPGKSLDWYRAQAMYLGRAAAVLGAAQDGP